MCDTVVSVSSGRVLFAKNSDRDPNEPQLLEWSPPGSHAEGARVRCTWIEIPQARRTYAALLSRPFWMWGAEIGANERGVVIGNEAVFTSQPYARVGLTGMDLLRLALERAATAEEAVEVITGLLGEHGQGGGCGYEDRSFTYHNSFLIADHRGAHVLETAGRRWAVERVSGARSISNGLTIGAFAAEHADPLKTRVACAPTRRARTEALAAEASGPADMMRLLRDHGPGRLWPSYSLVNGCMDCPCMHAGGAVVSSQTTGSWVAELTADGARHWVTGTSSPCVSLFKPVRVGGPLSLGPNPVGQMDEQSLWWRGERLSRRVLADPERLSPLFREERDEQERSFLESPPEPAAAFARGDALLARWQARVEADPVRDRRPLWTRRYWQNRRRAATPRHASILFR